MSYGDGRADLEMQFRPAINPQARVLNVILTGPTTRVTASVPLDWQEAS